MPATTSATDQQRHRRRRALTGVALAAVLLAACSSDDAKVVSTTNVTTTAAPTTTVATTAPQPAGSTTPSGAGAAATTPAGDLQGDAFYAPPSRLPAGRPGAVVRSRPISAPPGSEGWLIMYLSESATGQQIAVTATVFAPTAPPPAGGRSILAWAHGTTGLGDQCTPSKTTQTGSGAEWMLGALVVNQGLVFVATDYEGLGTPGVHTYAVGQSEGRSVLDSIRAARQLTDLPASTKSVVWGHSQGGGAALWAAELEPTYAPDVNLQGVAAGAPAVELLALGQHLNQTGQFGYSLMAVAGFHAAYPDLPLDQVVTPAGADAVDEVGGMCNDDVDRATADRSASSLLAPGAEDAPAWVDAYERNSPGSTKTDVPIFIYHGEADELVPVGLSATAAQKYCSLGVPVSRKTYPGADHTSVVPQALLDISTYLLARLSGQAAPSTC